MFYVSDINGVLRPLDELTRQLIDLSRGVPQTPPPGATTQAVESPSVAAVEAANEAAAAAPAASAESTATGSVVNDDAVVVSLHSPLTDNAAIGTAVATGAMAIATAAYRAPDIGHRVQSEPELPATPLNVHRVEPIEADHQSGARAKQYLASKHEALPADREALLTASDIMSMPVVTLPASAKVTEAFRLFQQHRFRHVPVLGERGELVGIVSDRDLFRLAAEDSLAARPSTSTLVRPISSVMITHVLTARPEASIRAIGEVMFEQRIGAMPIVDAEGALVGFLTRSDILRAVIRHLPVEQWT